MTPSTGENSFQDSNLYVFCEIYNGARNPDFLLNEMLSAMMGYMGTLGQKPMEFEIFVLTGNPQTLN
jgi:hypothetical protein